MSGPVRSYVPQQPLRRLPSLRSATPHGLHLHLHLRNLAFWGDLQNGVTRQWPPPSPNCRPCREQTLLQKLRPQKNRKQAAALLTRMPLQQ